MSAERAAACALLALFTLCSPSAAGASELLGIDEESRVEEETEAEWGAGRWSATLAASGNADGLEQPRSRLLWESGAWRGLAGWHPGTAAAWRGGVRGADESWSLAAGRLEGDWGENLLIGGRSRPGLGRIRPVSTVHPSPAPGAGGRALGTGLVAGWRSSGGGGDLAWIEDRAGEECLLLSVAGGAGALRALIGEGRRGLAAEARFRAQRQSLLIAIGWAARRGDSPRPALRWRAGHRGERISAALEGLSVAGAAPAGQPPDGWLGAGPGWELHAALFGTETGVGWRLGLRDRAGLGLDDDETRREGGLDLSTLLRGGRATLRLRRIATRTERPLLASPGFPRSEAVATQDQEMSVAWRGAWGWSWTWRSGADGVGSRQLTLSAPLRDLRCSLQLFSVARGMQPLVYYDSRALARRFESLDGSGWRLALSWRRALGPLGLRLGGSYTGRPTAADDAALWAELGLSSGGGQGR